MANALYDIFKQEALGAGNDLTAVNIKVILVDLLDYTFSAAHQDLADIPVAARVAISGNLTAKTILNGVFDAADVVFSAVTGDESEALIFYIDTGVEGTSRLILFLDTGLTGIPVTPNGGDINANWDNGANKIFAL